MALPTFLGGNDFYAAPVDLSYVNYGDKAKDILEHPDHYSSDQVDLAQTLKEQSLGQSGPNLAQDQLRQATNQTMQQQAGAIASTKGINPALAARIISEQGTQQLQGQAGQSGVLRSQQQLAAQSQLAQVLQQRQQGYDARLQTLGNLNQGQNQTAVQNVHGAQAINAGVAQANANASGNLFGSLFNAAAGAAGNYFGQASAANQTGNAPIGPSPSPGGEGGGVETPPSFSGIGSGGYTGGQEGQSGTNFGGGSPGYGYTPAQGGAYVGGVYEPNYSYNGGLMLKQGGAVPGKANVAGDSIENDTIHAMLSPGEIVLPRSIAGDGDKAKAFVEAILKRHGKKSKGGGYGSVLEAKRKAKDAA